MEVKNVATLGETLKDLRTNANLSMDQLAKELNTKYNITSFQRGQIAKWEKDTVEPKFSTLKYIADFFNIDLNTLGTLTDDQIDHYNQNYVNMPHMWCQPSAGDGNFIDGIGGFDDEVVEMLPYQKSEIPYGATYTMTVSGDSMQPEINDGDTIWINATKKPLVGQVGLFLYGNDLFIKEVGKDRLIATNPDYNDLMIDDDNSSEIRIQGTVVGVIPKKD